MRTLRDVKWLLTAGKPSPALKAATLLYLHGARLIAATKLKVRGVNFGTSPTTVLVTESRPVDITRTVFGTDELSSVLRGLSDGKSGADLVLGYASISEFQGDFQRMVRASKLYNFDLSDIKERFRAAAGTDYALLEGYKSEEAHTSEEIRKSWLSVLPRLVVGV